ncbi:MAG: hypothetical protein IPK52_00170 [Chloroflexi bacterium]|nr:hypothetical protein [Chloroflexota bacterium]
MKLYRVLNDKTAEACTELILTRTVADRYVQFSPAQAAEKCMGIILPRYGGTVRTLMEGSTPGVMNYLLMPAVLDAQNALVIDLYIDWNDEAAKLAGQKVRPTYKPCVLVAYYLCAPNELKALHHLVQREPPQYTDLTQKETA